MGVRVEPSTLNVDEDRQLRHRVCSAGSINIEEETVLGVIGLIILAGKNPSWEAYWTMLGEASVSMPRKQRPTGRYIPRRHIACRSLGEGQLGAGTEVPQEEGQRIGFPTSGRHHNREPGRCGPHC